MNTSHNRNIYGFTLIELLVVIAIIAILAANHGFTPIELLVVNAIIAILAAMLLPALAQRCLKHRVFACNDVRSHFQKVYFERPWLALLKKKKPWLTDLLLSIRGNTEDMLFGGAAFRRPTSLVVGVSRTARAFRS